MSLLQYFKDTRGELHHVSWPTQKQTLVYTALVIGLSIVTALYLGAFDYLFSQALDRVLQAEISQPVPVSAVPEISVDAVNIEGGNANIEVTPVEVPTE